VTVSPAPLCVLFAARICNETETLPHTLSQFLPIGEGGRGVRLPPRTVILLTYNPRPTNDKELARLQNCARIISRVPHATFEAICVPNGKCKTDVISAALAYIAGKREVEIPETLCFMDADTRVEGRNGYIGGVQRLKQAPRSTAAIGPAHISVNTVNFVVACEFQQKMFMVLGYMAEVEGWMTGCCYFIRTQLALAYGVDKRCLVEDNDLLVRLAADGYCMENLLSIEVSTEAAPNFASLLTQRTRWAQGASWIACSRMPHVVATASLGDAGMLRRWFRKMCWFGHWTARRLLAKYLTPFLMPAAIAFSMRCQSACAEADGFWLAFLGLIKIFLVISLLLILASACLPHKWLRWYHFMIYAFARIPYGIFLLQFSIIADARFLFGLNKWIETDRHKAESPVTEPTLKDMPPLDLCSPEKRTEPEASPESGSSHRGGCLRDSHKIAADVLQAMNTYERTL